MCFLCDGGTVEESLRFIELTILHHGWAVRGVLPDADDPNGKTWSYTIGLLENFNHPELVITDVEFERAIELLNHLGEDVRAGRDIEAFNELGSKFRPIHPAHLDSDLLGGWLDNYGFAPAPGQVWQVVLPKTYFCADHGELQTDLTHADQSPA